jgi:hypothetical protein
LVEMQAHLPPPRMPRRSRWHVNRMSMENQYGLHAGLGRPV